MISTFRTSDFQISGSAISSHKNIQKYYTDENIVYFEDYSIEKVIELSEVSKKWNDKFRLADASKEEFLKLPICKKVKDIIDASSVNEYVKSKKATKV